MHSEISPLLDISPISVGDLDREIQSVVSILIGAAQDCLPSIKRSNQKFILDHRVASLCKLSYCPDTINLAADNGKIIFTLPPNTTDLIGMLYNCQVNLS